ncbi:MAG TPA: DsrE family protein [Rhizobiaceae bacterium]|nr:DsrE family protein [Rhizobiaceae bacterium]
MQRFFTVFALSVALCAPAPAAEHKLAIHVDQADPAVMNLALNNAQNARQYYESKGDTVKIEIVAYGPGLNMYTQASPVKERISAMALETDAVAFSACGNTLAGMEKKAGKKIELMSEAMVTPSGVVRLMELQEQGWSYLRP